MESHPNPHIRELQSVLTRVNEMHAEIYGFLLSLAEGIKAGNYKTPDLIDIGFLLREISEKADDTRKEVNNRKEVCEGLIAYDMTTRSVAGEDVKDPMPGFLASGSPKVKVEIPQPRVGTPENELFIRWVGGIDEAMKKIDGIDPTVAEKIAIEVSHRVAAICKPEWKKLSELVTDCAARGKKIPPGLSDRQFTRFSTIFRRKNMKGGQDDSES